MLHEFRPKMRAEISIGHRKAGGLSTVMKFDESDEPKKKAFQLLVPGLDGGRVEGVGPAAGTEVPQVEDRRAATRSTSRAGRTQARRSPCPGRTAARPGRGAGRPAVRAAPVRVGVDGRHRVVGFDEVGRGWRGRRAGSRVGGVGRRRAVDRTATVESAGACGRSRATSRARAAAHVRVGRPRPAAPRSGTPPRPGWPRVMPTTSASRRRGRSTGPRGGRGS